MQDLYEQDAKTITEIVDRVRVKHMNGSTLTGDKLSQLHRELTGRLEDAGYLVTVDVTPLLAGQPPIVNVDGKQDVERWDFDKKAHEIKKRFQRKEKNPEIEGMI